MLGTVAKKVLQLKDAGAINEGGQSSSQLRTTDASGLSGFYLMATGQIESVQFYDFDNVYCRYSFTSGADWRVVEGVDVGLSQTARRGHLMDEPIIWNFPLDITFKSTNPHGWPRLILSVYGLDALGRDVIRGYGAVHLPTQPGTYTRYVRLFAPMSSSPLQALLSTIFGTPPEFYDARFITQNEGREVTRVRSTGTVKVVFNIVTKGMEQHGYASAKSSFLGSAATSTGLSSSIRSSILRPT